MIVEFGGDDDGEDDEVEKQIEVRRSEAREDEVPYGWSFIEDEM